MITGGTIKYGETRKIADFENKRADVELSFNVTEGQNYNEVLTFVQNEARCRCHGMLNGIGVMKTATDITNPPKELADTIPAFDKANEKWVDIPNPHKPHSKRAPKMPVLGGLTKDDEPQPILIPDPAAMPDLIEETIVTVETNIDLGGVKLISDAELMDATSKHQQQVKNPIAIKKLINDLGVKAPPGRLIDMPQSSRQDYLDKLKLIKPLA